MDFRVKKLILEEGMKNIAETEGVKLEMSFDDYHKTVKVHFYNSLQRYLNGVHKECSYSSIEDENTDVFATIEFVRREVRDMKNPIAAGIRDGMRRNEVDDYIRDDIRQTAGMITVLRESYARRSSRIPKIKNVIFNYPATIVFWEDGDKTVVKCQNGDMFDAEKGLAMAIIKKMNGGKGNYCEIFKPWMRKYRIEVLETFSKVVDKMNAESEENKRNAVIDIQDILEGKVDPLMIKVDEEPEECRSEPNPEYKEEKIVVKCCETCIHDDTRSSEERPKPCDSCTSKILDDGSVGDPSQWEPKE